MNTNQINFVPSRERDRQVFGNKKYFSGKESAPNVGLWLMTSDLELDRLRDINLFKKGRYGDFKERGSDSWHRQQLEMPKG